MARRKRSDQFNTSIAEFIDMITTVFEALERHPTCHPPWRVGVPTIEEILAQTASMKRYDDSVMAEYKREVHVARDQTRRLLKGDLAELIGYIELLLYDPEILQLYPKLDLKRHPIDSRPVPEKRRKV